MNKAKLFECLKGKKKNELLKLIENCFDKMKIEQINEVFYFLENEINALPSNGNDVLQKATKFMEDSINKKYYAPFDINSKNFTMVPEETQAWFEKMADLLMESTILTKQHDHVCAVKCFSILYELFDKMCNEDEIVFADEYGTWMLPMREEPCIKAYFQSAAAILNPEGFANTVLPAIRRDSYENFSNNAYKNAKKFANKEQKVMLDNLISQSKVIIPG